MHDRLSLSRRKVLGAAAATSALGISVQALGQDQVASAREPRTTFLLVHGAWHGGWCWRDVRAVLEGAGHRVITPTLSGLGERAHLMSPEIGLATHIEDILAVIRFEDLSNFVLVGHSYGGMVITGVVDAMRDRISHIVYLDAARPTHGQSMITQGPDRPVAVIEQTEAALRRLAPDGAAMNAFPPELLGIPADHPSYGWVAERLTPHPLKTWLDPIALENGGSDGLARSYIHCTDPVLPNSSFPWHAAETEADPTWHYRALATGHDAMITAPRETAALLLEAAVTA
ncbi:alpha/beta hydrolase [Parasphingopyxis sp. CP4]|nr:alpha/beta hydrolase [Parasphingopyxis sp. CP4]